MKESTVKKQTLDAFIKQREKRQNDTGIEANRLVNLYRQLPLFGEDFLETYNKMLMDASPEVQMTLSDIVGGSVVRQYLEFLKSKQLHTDENKAAAQKEDRLIYTAEEAYLPSADEIASFAPSFQNAPASFEGVDMAVSQDILKSQAAFLEQSLAKQTDLIEKTLGKIQENTSKHVGQNKNSADSAQAQEVQKAQLEAFNAALKEILQSQNKALTDAMQQIVSQTAEMNAKQLQAVEKLIASQGQGSQKASYPIVEEYAPEGYVAKEYTRSHEVLKPYEFKDIFPDDVLARKENKETEKAADPKGMKKNTEKDNPSKEVKSSKLPKPEKESKSSQSLDSDMEILSEIDLPSGIL